MKKEQEYLDGISLHSGKKKEQLIIFKRTRLFITFFASALGLYFGFLQLSGIEIDPFKNDEFADILMKINLLIYYLGWLNGTLMDLKDEEAIFILPPNKGKFTASAIGTLIILAILFFLLCSFRSNYVFVLILDGFLIANVISWKYLINFISNSVKENKEFYSNENKNYKSIYLNLMIDVYLKGNWQWWRFGIGAFILIIINVLVFTQLAQIISIRFNMHSAELVKAIGFLIFITVTEGWIWIMRLKRRTQIELIDTLDENYYISKRH